MKRLVFITLSLLFAITAEAAEPVVVKNEDISDSQYVFRLNYDDMVNGEKIRSYFETGMQFKLGREEEGAVYLMPETGLMEAILSLEFNFEQSAYCVQSVRIRESVNYFTNPDATLPVEVASEISDDGKTFSTLWTLQCERQSRHEPPFESKVDFASAKQVFYRLTFKTEDTGSSGFPFAAFQWNRLNSASEDKERAFEIVFALKKR